MTRARTAGLPFIVVAAALSASAAQSGLAQKLPPPSRCACGLVN